MTTEKERNNYANAKTASTGFLDAAGIVSHIRVLANLWRVYHNNEDDDEQQPEFFLVLNVVIMFTVFIQFTIGLTLIYQFNINVHPGDLHAKTKRRQLHTANYYVFFCSCLVLVLNLVIATLHQPITSLIDETGGDDDGLLEESET